MRTPLLGTDCGCNQSPVLSSPKVTTPTLDAEPACPGPADAPTTKSTSARTLGAEHRCVPARDRRGQSARRARSEGARAADRPSGRLHCGRDDVPAVTAALDVAVLPSYREAQGLSILEALALARPVVASKIGGIPEMIEDGVTGLLVEPHDAEGLAQAITRLLTDYPYADTLARQGHDLVDDRFCIELMVEAVEAITRKANEGSVCRRPWRARCATAKRTCRRPPGGVGPPGASSPEFRSIPSF